MSDTGQIIFIIALTVLAIGFVSVVIDSRSKKRRARRRTPEFIATGCTFHGRPIYLNVNGYADLAAAGDAVRDFKADQERP